MAKPMLKILGHLSAFVGLTLLTQIGGLAYLASLFVVNRLSLQSAKPLPRSIGVFAVLYGLSSAAALIAAPAFGRVPLPCFETQSRTLAMASPVYCLLNRHYVTPALREVSYELAKSLDQQYPGTLTQSLDAGVPFLTGFPMLPHLSHDDGRKLDFAFYYVDQVGEYRRGAVASPIGYWAFEGPNNGEPKPCPQRRDFCPFDGMSRGFNSL